MSSVSLGDHGTLSPRRLHSFPHTLQRSLVLQVSTTGRCDLPAVLTVLEKAENFPVYTMGCGNLPACLTPEKASKIWQCKGGEKGINNYSMFLSKGKWSSAVGKHQKQDSRWSLKTTTLRDSWRETKERAGLALDSNNTWFVDLVGESGTVLWWLLIS